MEYDMPLFRPPSEARSLIFQVTLGCSWNKCLFCDMYKTKKFLMRPFEELEKDVVEMSRSYPETKRIFMADGDALAAPVDHILKVLELMNQRFPNLKRISTYASPKNLKDLTLEELKMFKERKLDILYMGIETGNDELLKKIKKGASGKQMIEVGKKAIEAGLRMSTFIILGLGGVEGSYAHAKDSARVVNGIDPQFLATLTLMLEDEKVYEEKIMGGGFKLIDMRQSLQELRWFVEDLELTNCKFGTEHASNYLSISKTALPEDKEKILSLIDRALKDSSSGLLRPEWARGL
ncbi:MAG TPA: radical SAM protein [Dissulfurispiraceae bacterium]|nr:radical SAM protein [Dissulfurispiraceae bacterium]